MNKNFLNDFPILRIQIERLIAEAAFNPVVEKIPDKKLRGEIFETLQRRLGNE